MDARLDSLGLIMLASIVSFASFTNMDANHCKTLATVYNEAANHKFPSLDR